MLEFYIRQPPLLFQTLECSYSLSARLVRYYNLQLAPNQRFLKADLFLCLFRYLCAPIFLLRHTYNRPPSCHQIPKFPRIFDLSPLLPNVDICYPHKQEKRLLYPLIILLEMSLTYNTDKHYAKITFILGNIIAYAMIFTIYIHHQTITAK